MKLKQEIQTRKKPDYCGAGVVKKQRLTVALYYNSFQVILTRGGCDEEEKCVSNGSPTYVVAQRCMIWPKYKLGERKHSPSQTFSGLDPGQLPVAGS